MTHFAKLTDAKIRTLKPKDKAYKAFDGQGLFLEVMTNCNKKWRFRYIFNGQDKRITLGTYPTLSLKEARSKTEDARRLLADKKAPLEERNGPKQAQSEVTFLDIAMEWEGLFLTQLNQATIKKKKMQFRSHVYPYIGNLAIKDITSTMVLELVLRPILSRGQLETAQRAKSLCGQIFTYAINTNRLTANPTLYLRGAIPSPKVRHRSTIIEHDKIGKLIIDINNYSGHLVVRHALQLLALVFVRPGELRKAEWSEINWDESMWRIPAAKMKMGAPHIVPLSRQALAVLSSLHQYTGDHQYLFPGQRAKVEYMSDAALNAGLRYLGYSGADMTAHGFRAMASTVLNEKGYNRDWIERQLAHAERDSVRAAYNYADYLPNRTKMMQDWANTLDDFVEKTTCKNV